MTEENDFKRAPGDAQRFEADRSAHQPQSQQSHNEEPQGEQAKRDAEIEAIQQHSRHLRAKL